MNKLDDKKIPVKLILTSITFLLISYLIKEPYDEETLLYYQSIHVPVPLSLYSVYLFGLNIPYKIILIIACTLIALGIYLLFYETDENIKQVMKKIKVPRRIKPIGDKNVISDEALLQKKLSDKISINKDVSIIAGWIMLWVTIIISSANNDIIGSLNITEARWYLIIIVVTSIFFRAVSVQVCYNFTMYNKGHKWIWCMFGVLMPSIALIVAGMKRTLKYEYKYLLEYYEKN